MTVLKAKIDSTWVTVGGVGPAGADGVGIPGGGTAAQVLAKVDATDFNTQWATLPSTTPADNSITNAKLRDSAATSVIGRAANSTGDPADIATGTDGQVLRRAAGALGFGALDLADTDAVTGVLPAGNGGTGGATIPTIPVPLAQGGTGATTAAAARTALQVSVADGQCRLAYVSATQIRLTPYAGDWLVIDGTPRQIAAGGVTLANTGLPTTAVVYIYAAWSGSAVTLEGSTTAPVELTPGFWVKGGDATRRAVGIVRTGGGTPGVFIDLPAFRAVRSAFHPIDASLYGAITGAVTQAWPAAGAMRPEMEIGWLTAELPESRFVTLAGSARAATTTYLQFLLSVNGAAAFNDLATTLIAGVGDLPLTLPGVVDSAPWTFTTLDVLIASDGTTSVTVSAATRLWATCRV